MEEINLHRLGRSSPSKIEEERTNLQNTKDVIQKAWDAEIKCYEMGHKQEVTHPSQLSHLSPRIFPYHKSCYLLLDMYLCVEGEFLYKMPFFISEYARRNDDITLEEGYLPNSAYAIWSSLIPAYRARITSEPLSQAERTLRRGYEDLSRDPSETIWVSSDEDPLGSDFSFMKNWAIELEKDNKKWYRCSDYGEVAPKSSDDCNNEQYVKRVYYGLPLFETLPKGQRTKILLKLLKHSTSELQHDHRLGRAVLLAMIEYKCFDGDEGVEAFRYFLVTIQSEFIHDCDGACQDRGEEDDDDSESGVNHVCTDWQKFTHAISRVFQWGFRHFTPKHVMVLNTFFKDVLTSGGWEEAKDLHDIVGWNDDDYTMAKDTPLDFVTAILEGISRLNYQYRYRILELLKVKYRHAAINASVDEELHSVVRSHLNCTDALVLMSASILKSCPATPVTETIGSLLTTGLVLSTIDSLHEYEWFLNESNEGKYIGSNQKEHIRPLIDATRYADTVTYASVLFEQRLHQFKGRLGTLHPAAHKIEEDDIVAKLFLSPAPISVNTVVRGLFLRQLVETNEVGCGYGDFILWSGSAILPHDPLLYEHTMNFPNTTGYDEERLQDDNGQLLTTDQIKARYDLSMLMLRRSWSLPWTPSSHDSFQIPFKKAVRTIALVAHRHRFPLDLCALINSFLSREWWPDQRAQCWRYDCQIDDLQEYLQSIERDAVEDPTESSEDIAQSSKKLIKCNGCRVVYACSKNHMIEIFHEGHLRECRCPPMRIPNGEDLNFCSFYLNETMEPTRSDTVALDIEEDNIVNTSGHDDNAIDSIDGYDDGDDDGDDDDWESIGSNEELDETDSKTAVVLKYFENKAYKVRKREEHAFANHYAE